MLEVAVSQQDGVEQGSIRNKPVEHHAHTTQDSLRGLPTFAKVETAVSAAHDVPLGPVQRDDAECMASSGRNSLQVALQEAWRKQWWLPWSESRSFSRQALQLLIMPQKLLYELRRTLVIICSCIHHRTICQPACCCRPEACEAEA